MPAPFCSTPNSAWKPRAGAQPQRRPAAGLRISGYDNTQPGRLPDLLPHVSVKRIVDWGADAVKILIYYTPFEEPPINDIKHAFIERIGAECETYDIPFFLEFVGYDPKGGDEKGFEYAKAKPEIVTPSMEEFSKPQYSVDVLKVEVPINAEFVEGSVVSRARRRTRREEAMRYFREAAAVATKPFIYLSAGVSNAAVRRIPAHGHRSGHRFLGRPVRARHLERRHSGLCQARREGAGRVAASRRREEHQGRQRSPARRHALVRENGHRAARLRDARRSLTAS